MINFDTNLLLTHFQSKAGLAPTGPAVGGKQAPLAPWSPRAKPPEADQRVRDALANKPILDVAGAKRKLSGGEEDYGELFALYSALDTLKALARRLDAKGVTAIERSQVERKFRTGMADVTAYVDKIDLDKLRLVRGVVNDSATSQGGVRRERPEYKTAVIHRGALTDEVASLQGAVTFSMSVKPSVGATKTVTFDLSEMGTKPRTMANVVDYLNEKLKDAGVTTRFGQEQLPPQKNTIKVGDNVLTLPDGPLQSRLKITGVSSETISFSAPDKADAVFLGQTVGKDGAQSRQLTKLQTDSVTGAPPAAHHDGQANWIDGRVFNQAIDGDVLAVRASATHSDGSVYMLAEVAGSVAGQTIKGERDVALLKYDSAGNLVFSRNLGAASQANAAALAVAADGTVAIGGSVRGELMGVQSIDSTNLDSFVTTFNAEGEEIWTQRGGSLSDDEVRALTFGADGTLYVAGRSQGAMIGESALGGGDGWLRAFKTTTSTQADGTTRSTGEVLFTTQYGSSGADVPAGLAVDGSTLVVAGVENGRAVVRRFDLQPTGDPVQSASQDLGELLGGRIAGVSIDAGRVILAGSTANGGLSAASTLAAHSGGGQDVFVYNIDAALTAGSAKVSYWGGMGADQATAVAMDGSDVYVAGSTNDAIAGLPKIGVKDGFVVRLNADTGAQEWARRFTGQDGEVAPTTIAVGKGQASVLDRLGLPSGTIDYTGSQLVTANSSARAGDRFYIKVGENGRSIAVTVEANDTLKTLAAKVTRAVGFNATVTIPTQNRYLDDANINAGTVLVERLQITPRRDKWLEIRPGEGNRDLLDVLGLEEGVIRSTRRDSRGKEIVPPGGRTYGLGLPRDLAIDGKEAIARTAKELDDAMVLIQNIYRDLSTPAAAERRAGNTGGTVPAHLRAQIANYSAGLARLSNGGGF